MKKPIYVSEKEDSIVSITVTIQPRKISNRELADLSTNWENPTVDTAKYYQCVLSALEVDLGTYEAHKRDGGLCQKFNNNFYIA